MEGFNAELLSRLPLAKAVLVLWSYVMIQEELEKLYEENRGFGYERELSFSSMVMLVRDALLEHQGSACQSFERAREHGQLEVSNGSAYGKLGRLPLKLSEAFFAYGAGRLQELLPPDSNAQPLPVSLSALETVVIDGKTIKHLSRRLKLLRAQAGRIVGGKIVAALSLSSGLALAMAVDPSGYRNDLPLVPGIVEQVQAVKTRPILWVADGQYCNLTTLRLFDQNQDHFLVSYSAKLCFTADSSRSGGNGKDAQGCAWTQEWGWLGRADNKERRYVRRVHLHLEKKALILVTDLLDETLYPAIDLLEAYRRRWGIEQVFQQITEVFSLKHLIGSTPQATLFQAAFCLLLYDMIQVVRAYVAGDGGFEVKEVSSEKLFYDMHRDLISWTQAADWEIALAILIASRPATAAALRAALSKTLTGVWTDRWIKAKPTRHRRTPRTTPMPPCGRTSVFEVIQKAREPTPRANNAPQSSIRC